VDKLKRFGIDISIVKSDTSDDLNRSSIIRVSCLCGHESDLKISSIVRTIQRVGFYRCVSCGMKAKHQDPLYQINHHNGMKRSWSKERRQQQSGISKTLWKDSNFRQIITKSVKITWDNGEKRQKASVKTKNLWNDSSYLSKQIIANGSKSEISSKIVLGLWTHPEYRNKQIASKYEQHNIKLQSFLAKERWKDSEYRESVIGSIKEFYSDPLSRAHLSKCAIEKWKDPEYVKKQVSANIDPNILKLKSLNAKQQWTDTSIRQKIIDGIKKIWESNEYRSMMSEISKNRWKNSDYKKKQALGRASILQNGKDSILERISQNILGNLQIPYIRHHVIGYFEFDLFIPSHSLLIECNGEYWHSLRKSRDAAKFTYIDEYFPEYKVLYLWERDFLNPGLIHQKLVQALSLDDTSSEQIDFSFDDVSIQKMDVKDIAPGSYYSTAEEFFQSFHYAGYGRAAKSIFGAYLNNKLIGAVKFSSPGRMESATSMGLSFKDVLELDRFCLHPFYQKKNFSSWLLSRVSNLIFNGYPNVKTLISFADSTFGHSGTIYKASNWKEIHKTRPDYHYLSLDGFVIHKKTLYDHASRNGHSEANYADIYGYTKVFGKSKTKFALSRG
jgi:very-short-patch-repair endonuclease/GNAT superfamily N-acetyltransferase